MLLAVSKIANCVSRASTKPPRARTFLTAPSCRAAARAAEAKTFTCAWYSRRSSAGGRT